MYVFIFIINFPLFSDFSYPVCLEANFDSRLDNKNIKLLCLRLDGELNLAGNKNKSCVNLKLYPSSTCNLKMYNDFY